jgi:dihydroorotase
LTAVSLGFEDRELLQTDFRLLPKWFGDRIATNSFPVIDNQSQVNFVLNKALGFATHLPYWCINEGGAGKDMAELFDMKKAGAIAFGDYNKSLDNANLKSLCNTFKILMD